MKKILIIILLSFSLQAETFDEYKSDVINKIVELDGMVEESGLHMPSVRKKLSMYVTLSNKSTNFQQMDMITLIFLKYRHDLFMVLLETQREIQAQAKE